MGWRENYLLRIKYGSQIDLAESRLRSSADLERGMKRLKKKNEELQTQNTNAFDQLVAMESERNEARKIAEKFREKYLDLKQKEEARKLRADIEMNKTHIEWRVEL